ncbi:DegT/DnrJ/EryC1/StrS family aminotransferase [Ottowia sp.]|uniref:DegT/DnrJ/EryC1/StrS family aminotransferase n=1 Tax=Ottowia sp. TaxID=1898956 RepID=UPI0025D2A4B7|nr:DegT/DnrJ/EryC1/StrS family aminotransferase [Ottowia sp.]
MPSPAVPFFSPRGAAFGVDLGVCLQGVVDSGWYVLGPNVREFEQAFARYVGVGHAVGVANGTDALALALRALGIGPGQRVATVANAGCYASTAIAQVGAVPCFVDVDEGSLTLSPDRLRATLRDGPVGAVILTHLYGRMGEASAIAALCRQAGVPLIEDCAQAHGAVRAGRQAGAWGAVACFSFYPTKNLGALGDGGAVLTDDTALAERLRALRQYGWARKYEVALAGGVNSRLDELQAAVLLAKLPRLDAANAERRAIATRYGAAFADLPLACPPLPGEDDVAHLYVVRTPRRAELQAHLAARGIASDVHYPVPDHRQPVRAGQAAPDLPVTEAACAEVLSLPCYPGLTPAQAEQVVGAVRGFFDQARPC